MSYVNQEQVSSSLIDISGYDVAFTTADTVQLGELSARIAKSLASGYCVCYGTNKVMARNGLNLRLDRERGYQLLESLFRSALAQIDISKFSVIQRPMIIERMDVDGYNLNQSFSHDGKIASREFMTAKCLHFDAATPFVANIYGPNDNIQAGLPLICDVRPYCRQRRIDPRSLVDNLPNNYNIAIKEEFYEDLLRDYSFAYDLELEHDIVVVMLLNEVAFGVAHGALDPKKRNPARPAFRPIRHIEMQYVEESHYSEWYAHYGVKMISASNYAGENLTLNYYSAPQCGTPTVIPVYGQ